MSPHIGCWGRAEGAEPQGCRTAVLAALFHPRGRLVGGRKPGAASLTPAAVGIYALLPNAKGLEVHGLGMCGLLRYFCHGQTGRDLFMHVNDRTCENCWF